MFFVITLIGAAYHFSSQSMAATKHLRPKQFNSDIFFNRGKILLFLTGIFGIFHYASLNSGVFRLFNLSLQLYQINAQGLLALKLVLVFLHLFFIYKYWHKSLCWVPYIAYVSWNLSYVFCKDYYYWIAIFHAFQYLPFYFARVDFKKTHIHFLNLAASIGFVFLLPNFLNNSLGLKQSYFFVMVLLCINLHHFAMESVGWKKSTSS